MNSNIVIVSVALLLVAFGMAWRGLKEFDVPLKAYPEDIRREKNKVKKWGKIVFLKGKELFYES